MIDFSKSRLFIFLTVFLLMIVAAVFLLWQEGQYCLGVEILSQKQADRYCQYRHQDCSDILTFQDEVAAIDGETATIYISQDIQPETTYRDLIGKLKITNETYDLYFVEDPLFFDMDTAVKEAHPFPLLITDGSSAFMQYNVVFTSLPVICLNGTASEQMEQGRPVSDGNMCIWTPIDPDTGGYCVKSSPLQWHIRGYSSSTFEKKSWKLSLKTEDGENCSLSLLGLGKDDDWILNAMYLDDTKLKEKLVMGLWNQLASQTQWNYKMSSGEYAEVIVNGKYHGLYLLQRRVDAKYLDLDQSDVLLKGMNTWTPATIYDAYEIISSTQTDVDPFLLMQDGSVHGISLETEVKNFIDVNILLQFAAAGDNTGFKNMFYLLQRNSDSYSLTLIPWDTDISFGLYGSSYHYAYCLNVIVQRMEYASVEDIYPDLDKMAAVRWFELRNDILSEANISSVLDQIETKLTNSGAYVRDQQLWEPFHKGMDTQENLRKFIEERLEFLDTYYAAA